MNCLNIYFIRYDWDLNKNSSENQLNKLNDLKLFFFSFNIHREVAEQWRPGSQGQLEGEEEHEMQHGGAHGGQIGSGKIMV